MIEKHIGMMDSAYFVPRQQIFNWINKILNINIQYIEDLGQGSVYCHLLDAAFTNKNLISMNKINWKAKFEYDCAANLKYFQLGLDKLNTTKKIDIEKLAKGKYQQNLQIIQWLKKYIENHGIYNPNYNALQRRNFAVLQSLVEAKKNISKNSNAPTAQTLRKDQSIKRLSYKYITSNPPLSSRKLNQSSQKQNYVSGTTKSQNQISRNLKKDVLSSTNYAFSNSKISDQQSLLKIKNILLNQFNMNTQQKLKEIKNIVVCHFSNEKRTINNPQTNPFLMINQDQVQI